MPPVEAVAAHVRANPEDPCVVYPDAMGDWRWKPWRWLAAEAQRWVAALRAAGVEAGALVGYRWRPSPELVAADLGIQAAGAVAVPVVEGDEAALPPLAVWLATTGDDPPAAVPRKVISVSDRAAPFAASEGPDRPADFEGPIPNALIATTWRAGGALVRRGDSWHQWNAPELAREATALVAPPRRHRPVVLVAGDLAAAEERAWLGWALAAGAALVLPGDSAFAAWAIFWPRPTDVCLPAEALTGVRELMQTLGSGRALRRRLARLRRLLVWGASADEAESQAWRALGVTLAPFPPSPGSQPGTG